MIKQLSAVALVLSLSVICAVAQPNSRWELFGNAISVKQGQPPNPWAVQLTSSCPGGSCADTFTYSVVNLKTTGGGLTFAGITVLSADYKLVNGCFAWGAPRFQINVDTGDGVIKNIFVYIGTPPGFTDCSPLEWLSTGNLISATDKRFDTSQINGVFYNTYDGALAIAGTFPVTGVQLVLDGSAGAFPTFTQTVLADNITMNQFKLTANK